MSAAVPAAAIQIILDLSAQGITQREISAQTGVSKSAIGRIVKAAREGRSHCKGTGGGVVPADVRDAARKLLADGVKPRIVAKQTGAKLATVREWARQMRAAQRADVIEQEMRAGDGAQGDVAPVAPATVQPAPTYSADPYVASLMARGLSRADAIYSAGLYRQRRWGGAHAQV